MKDYKVVACRLSASEKENFLRCVSIVNRDALYRYTASLIMRSLLLFFIYNGEKYLSEILSVGLPNTNVNDTVTISTRLKPSDAEQLDYYIKTIRVSHKLQGHNVNVSGIMRRLIYLYSLNPLRWQQLIDIL